MKGKRVIFFSLGMMIFVMTASPQSLEGVPAEDTVAESPPELTASPQSLEGVPAEDTVAESSPELTASPQSLEGVPAKDTVAESPPELTSSPQSLESVPAEDTVAESYAIQTAIKKTPVFVQPFTRILWNEAQAGAWDIRHMQLYVSGTVVLEYEKYSTDLTARTNSQSVEETLRGINYTGTVSTNEMITNSAYENALIVLETMTPGVALNYIPGKWQNILEVSFEGDTADQQKFLRFVQNYNDSDGYFYLEPLNKTKITYGDKKYEIRFNERGGSPYLMIRTEYTASTRSNILPGRRIP